MEDLAILTGATVINEELGDDLDGISLDILGEVEKTVTDDKNTVFTTVETTDVSERIKEVTKLKNKEKDGFLKRFLEKRLTMLSGSVAIIRVGADSKVELKEKKDRVEDAIYATKAALKEGIVPGGGIALLNASQYIEPKNVGEKILLNAIKAPFETILYNAGIEDYELPDVQGFGIDVITNDVVDMVDHGIIDPLLVTKTALKNAISVVSTIISANCVISNIRVNESS
jgi:chaperonin GroEL